MDENGSVTIVTSSRCLEEPGSSPESGATDEDLGDGRTAAESVLTTPEWPHLGGLSPEGTGDPGAPEVAQAPVDFDLEIEDGETTLFEAAINAFHAGEYQRAESLFLEEAQRTLETAPQRAAISYRQAALAAEQMGNRDASDHWMRLAGREYLRVTEDDRTPLPFIREAAVMAAKCFLSVENLKVASKGLRRAQAIESVLRADDDLMAEDPADPVELPPADVQLRVERRVMTRPAPTVSNHATYPGPPTHDPSPDHDDEDPATASPGDAPTGHRGWLRRLRAPRPARPAA